MADEPEETEAYDDDEAPPSEDPRFVVVETRPDRYPNGRLGGFEADGDGLDFEELDE